MGYRSLLLVDAITSATTTISINDPYALPNSGYFKITIDSEILLAKHQSGQLFVVVRGADQTAAAAHSSGSIIYLCNNPIQPSEMVLAPEGPVAAQGTRIGQTALEGASYILPVGLFGTKVAFRLTAATLPVTARVLLYQNIGNVSTVANLIATADFSLAAPGAQNVTVIVPGFSLSPGICYVLFGRQSSTGACTFRVYNAQTYDLLNSGVDTGNHPIQFTTTALANSTPPATFDPLAVTTVATALSTCPVIRLLA